MKTLEEHIADCDLAFKDNLEVYHNDHKDFIDWAWGSAIKHQAWVGGYRNHIEQCLDIAHTLYYVYNFPTSFSSVFLVLYFHDIEKIFKYCPQNFIMEKQEESKIAIFEKDKYYQEFLPKRYGITFLEAELNALKYVHGEGDDYGPEIVMNELAGLCHACDVLSARSFPYDKEIRRIKIGS